jgi:hypothetical protein
LSQANHKHNLDIVIEDMSPSAIATIETTLSLTSFDSFFEDSKNSYIEHHNGGTYGLNNPKQLIGKALKERVENIDHDVCAAGDEDTFFVADLGEVYRQHMRWKLNLPRVKPFYGEIFPPHLCANYANTLQLSSATPTPRSFASWQGSELASTAPQRLKLSRS